jgi:hypothetical protein
MDLTHYTYDPFTFDRDYEYEQGRFRWDKPSGFWVSVDGEDDWPSWCRSEGFRTDSLEYAHTVTLKSDAHILHLYRFSDLLQFTAEYVSDIGVKDYTGAIDWGRVAQKYDGIIIAPYCWEARLDERTGWYYGWDCASGCIWNLDAIASVEEKVTVH